MNNPFKTAFLVCSGLALLIALFALAANDRYRFANAGIAFILIAVVYFFLGFILLIPKQVRKVGQAMLLCSLLILLIGISVCSLAPYSFSVH